MLDVSRIGIKHDEEVEFIGPEIIAQRLKRFQTKFSVKFPSEYFDFMTTFNGGLPTLDWVETTGQGRVINCFFHIGAEVDPESAQDPEDYENLWYETIVFQGITRSTGIPFANDLSSENYFYFKFNPKASIYFFDLSLGKSFEVAVSFCDFINSLTSRPKIAGPSHSKKREVRKPR